MYRSLGCFHTLQPGSNPFVAPAIPALTPEGFVRWQFIQILLDPDAHVPLLQEAVKRFEIRRPDGGEPFPHLLPEEALPLEADRDILAWHKDALETLRHSPPPRASSVRGSSVSRRANDEVQSITDSSADDSSFVDASEYFPSQRRRASHAAPRVIPPSPDMDEFAPQHEPRGLPEREQVRSEIGQQRISDEPWFSDGPTPTASVPPVRPRPHHLGRSLITRTSRTQSPYSSDHQQAHSSSSRERFQRSIHPSRSGDRLVPFLDAQGRRHSAGNVHEHGRPSMRHEHSPSHTLSPPFYVRPSPSDLPNEAPPSRPHSAVRFETPSYEPRRSRPVSHPMRSEYSHHSSSSSSDSDHEEAPARHGRSSSNTRDERQHASRRHERR